MKTKRTYDQQVLACQKPIVDRQDKERRMRRGEQQTFCKTCERWQWKHEECRLYNRDEAYEQAIEKSLEPSQ